MDAKTVKLLQLEIGKLNEVENEGESLDKPDEFKKFMTKQMNKICRKDLNNTTGTIAQETSLGASQETDMEQGDGNIDDVYNFNNPERGLAVIISNEDFSLARAFGSKEKNREGSTWDESALYLTFKNLGFVVWVIKNLKAWQIAEVLKLARNYFNENVADCFVCAILSHGEEGRIEGRRNPGPWTRQDLIVGIDGQYIATKTIVNLFNDKSCPSLEGKPRLFFIQACRGKNLDDGVKVLCSNKTESPDVSLQRRADQENPRAHTDVPSSPACPTPLYKDSLIMYAAPPGYFAWRKTKGSPFVQNLCTVLSDSEIGQRSLLKALVEVIGKVTQNYTSNCPSIPLIHEKKTIPVIEFMLMKDIFLTKKLL